MLTKRKFFIFNTIFLFCFFTFCILISLNRLVARDEGFYITASELLLKNKTLYKDFFFPQMPFTALFYAFCMKIFGISWYVARGATGLIYFITGSLLFFYIKKYYSNLLAIFSLILFVIHPMAFTWQSVIKSYALVNLFLLTIFILANSFVKASKNNRKIHFLIGIIFGLLVLTRLHFVVIFPLIIFHIYIKQSKISLKDLLYFGVGSLLSLSPAIYYFVLAPNDFIFNNLGYHLVRSQTPSEATLQFKITSLCKILGLMLSQQVIKTQMLLTYFCPIVFGIFYFFIKARKHIVYFPILYTILITFLNLIPSPTYLQYHSCIIIFIIIMTVDLVHSLNQRIIKYCIAFGFITINLIYFPKILIANTITAENVIGISGQVAEMWNIYSIEKISEHINKIDSTGYIYAFWPGHALNIKHKFLPGTENPFLIRVSDNILKNYNSIKREEILTQISNGNVGIVVYKDGDTINKVQIKNFLIKNNFVLRSRIGNIFIWSKYDN